MKSHFSPKRAMILGALMLLPVIVLAVLLSQQSPVRQSPTHQLPTQQSPTQQRPQPGATGHVYYAHPGDNLVQKTRRLAPGDTLMLTDGIYSVTHTAPGLRIENVHGTAVAPILIEAAHDGKAIIDGQNGTQGNSEPVFITNSSYVTVQGIVARNSYGNVVYVYAGSGSGAGPDDHIILRRITAYNAGAGNNHIFNVSFGPTNVLVEDCAGWGRGRYIFIAYRANNVTFRRDWAYQAYTQNFSPAPRSSFGVYGSSNVTLENVIGINTIPPEEDDNYYTGTWETSSNSPTNSPSNNTRYSGSLFFNDCEGIAITDAAGDNTTFKDVYIDIPYNSTCQSNISTHYTSKGIDWGRTGRGSITNVTFANNYFAFNRATTTSINLTNSIFLNNGLAISNDPGHSYLDFYGNGSNGTDLNPTDKTVDPSFDISTYGRGAYLFVPQDSPLKGAGENGADIGANIIYRYVDGVLTNQPLWPWPMEGRIMAEKGISVTWEAHGGIWKTLNGVYANTTSLPIPVGRSAPASPDNSSYPTPGVAVIRAWDEVLPEGSLV